MTTSRRILVIGGTRFIGAAVVRHLHAARHTVAVFHRGETPGELPASVEHIHGDARAALTPALRDALRSFAPDTVLHNIVLGEPDVIATHELFDGIARRLIMTSSMDVYRVFGRLHGTEPGPRLPLPIDEDGELREVLYPYRDKFPDPSHRMHHYDKIPAERAALGSERMPGTVLRLPMVIGPHDWQRRLLGLAKPMADGREAIVWSDEYAAWQSTYGFVENVAAAMALAATDDRAIGRTYNVCDVACSMRELADHARAATGWSGRIVTAPGERLPEALRFEIADPHPLVVSAARIGRELGFVAPVPFAEGVARTVEWELANVPDPLPPGVADYAAEDEALKALGEL
ncbi:MAG: NAD-dependent epimerase/dehydratase family protein [Planctomycetota bacterium]